MTRACKVFAVFLLAAILAAPPVHACTKVDFEAALQQMDAFRVVVRARVMEAKVLPLADLGIPCDKPEESGLCDVLELDLSILEEFKGTGERHGIVYAPVIPLCREPVLVGWEYVFFLAEFDDLIASTEETFLVRDEEGNDKLAKLRNWKAAQPH